MPDDDTARDRSPTADLAGDAPSHSAGRKRRIGISLGTLVALVTLATGILTLRDQLFPADGVDPPAPEGGEIQRFEGVAGHFEDSRAILGFLDQHDGEAVQLDVSFPDLAGTDNYIGDPGTVTYVQVFTECTPDLPSGQEPAFADGCMATSLELQGPQNDDSNGYLEHGVPVLEGYFSVDVTGALQMGVTPIFLEPLTFEQATGS